MDNLNDKPVEPVHDTGSSLLAWWSLVIVWFVVACSIYANTSYEVTDKSSYRYFPPFRPFVNRNLNDHLGSEYFNIAKSLVKGGGFADPFGDSTGPTAWMPPVLPAILAGILWLADGDVVVVTNVVITLQVLTLIATGVLCLVIVKKMDSRSVAATALLFVAHLVNQFWYNFQFTHDCWWIMLLTDVLVASALWGKPLATRWRAMLWGAFGSAIALSSPVAAFAWGVMTLALGRRRSQWGNLALALVTAAMILAPWGIRNYRVFGRIIPVKSNAAFELYQSQCLQPDGILQPSSFLDHPFSSTNTEGGEYRTLGEIRFLDEKGEQFWTSVRDRPWNWVRRIVERSLAATLVYVPFDREKESSQRPWAMWLSRLVHPLPFLSLVYLVFATRRSRLSSCEWIAATIYLAYIIPYAAVSYYERYAIPLLGVKTLLPAFAWTRLLRQSLAVRPVIAKAVDTVSHEWNWWSHRGVLGWFVLAATLWFQGNSFTRILVPVIGQQGNAIVLPAFFHHWRASHEVLYGRLPDRSLDHAVGVYAGVTIPSGVSVGSDGPPVSPTRTFLLMPLGLMDFHLAFAIWNILSILIGSLAVWGLLANSPQRVPGWTFSWFLTAIVLGHPFWHQVANGHTVLMSLGFGIAAWVAGQRHRSWTAGIFLGVALSWELSSLFFVIAFWASNRSTTAILAVGVWVVVAVAGLCAVGLSGAHDYEMRIDRSLLASPGLAPNNLSVSGAVNTVWMAIGDTRDPHIYRITAIFTIVAGSLLLFQWIRQNSSRLTALQIVTMILWITVIFRPITVSADWLLPIVLILAGIVTQRLASRLALVGVVIIAGVPPTSIVRLALLVCGDESSKLAASDFPQCVVAACQILPCAVGWVAAITLGRSYSGPIRAVEVTS